MTYRVEGNVIVKSGEEFRKNDVVMLKDTDCELNETISVDGMESKCRRSTDVKEIVDRNGSESLLGMDSANDGTRNVEDLVNDDRDEAGR